MWEYRSRMIEDMLLWKWQSKILFYVPAAAHSLVVRWLGLGELSLLTVAELRLGGTA